MPAAIGDAAHQAVERVDLAHEMALAKAADGRIAGHRADRVGAQRHQRGDRAEARRRTRSFAACMAAADNNDIVVISHHATLFSEGRHMFRSATCVKFSAGASATFHVKHYCAVVRRCFT